MFSKSIRSIILFGLLSTGSSALAQYVGVQGPVSGFIYEEASHSIRPILGIPGASYVGTVLFPGMDFAVVAPNSKSAIFGQAGQLSLLRGLDTGSPSTLALDQAVGGVDRVVWSPDSSQALLYTSTTRQVQRVNLVPEPQFDPPVALPAESGQIGALAVSPSGQIAIAFRGRSTGLYLISADGSLTLLTTMVDPGAIAFTRNGDGLFALDAKGARILEVDNISSSPAVFPFTDLSNTGATCKVLAVSANGQFLYVGGANPDRLVVFETASHTQTDMFLLAAPPTRLDNLSDSVYLLNDGRPAGTPLLLFQASPQAKTWFVPAPQPTPQED